MFFVRLFIFIRNMLEHVSTSTSLEVPLAHCGSEYPCLPKDTLYTMKIGTAASTRKPYGRYWYSSSPLTCLKVVKKSSRKCYRFLLSSFSHSKVVILSMVLVMLEYVHSVTVFIPLTLLCIVSMNKNSSLMGEKFFLSREFISRAIFILSRLDF